MSVYQHILLLLMAQINLKKLFMKLSGLPKRNKPLFYLATIINDAEFTTSPFSFEELYDLENTSQKRCSLERQNKRVKLV